MVSYVSHATQQRLQNLVEKISETAQQKNFSYKVTCCPRTGHPTSPAQAAAHAGSSRSPAELVRGRAHFCGRTVLSGALPQAGEGGEGWRGRGGGDLQLGCGGVLCLGLPAGAGDQCCCPLWRLGQRPLRSVEGHLHPRPGHHSSRQCVCLLCSRERHLPTLQSRVGGPRRSRLQSSGQNRSGAILLLNAHVTMEGLRCHSEHPDSKVRTGGVPCGLAEPFWPHVNVQPAAAGATLVDMRGFGSMGWCCGNWTWVGEHRPSSWVSKS